MNIVTNFFCICCSICSICQFVHSTYTNRCFCSVLCICTTITKYDLYTHVYHTTSTYTHICYSYPAGTTISPSRTSLLPSGGQLDLQTGQFKCPLTNQVVKHSA